MARMDPHSYYDVDQPRTRSVRFKWAVDFKAGRLVGEVALTLEKPSSGPMDLDTRMLSIKSVTAGGALVPHELGEPDPVLGQRLRLNLPPDTTEILIAYETSQEATALQWLTPGQTAGRKHPFMFSQCQPHHARALAPLQDSPRVRVTYTAEVTVPEDLTAVMSAGSAGIRTGPGERSRTFLFDMPQAIPTYLIALAVGDLASRDLSPRSRIWAETVTVDKAAWEFAGIEDMIVTAESLFGPYEWDRYDMLVLPPAFPYGGMENPRLTFLTPTLLAGDRSLVAVVVHELAHSWTGNLVTNATMNDFWLNEGFTVWAERRILEALHGQGRAAMSWAIGKTGLDEAFGRFGADSPFTRLKTDLWGVDPDSMYSEVPYEKGARFVALLEKTAGRAKFDKFIREYIDRFRFTSITTEEFLEFLEAMLPGLAGVVGAKAWIYAEGLPANSPVFESPELAHLQQLSSGWSAGVRPSAAESDSWDPDHTLIYLQGLPRALSHGDCEWLDEALALTGRGNYEILVEWLTIAAGSDYQPTFARIREVLTTVGRMKYLRPLYKALGATPRTRELAREIFADAAPGYHSLSRKVAEGIIAAYPAG
jgi:leukotriene-A4 hydrolase